MKMNMAALKTLELKLAEYIRENEAIAEHTSENTNCSSGCMAYCNGTCNHRCGGDCGGTCTLVNYRRNERNLT